MRTNSRIATALFVGALGVPALWAAGPDYAVNFGYGSQPLPPAEHDAPGGKKRVVLAYFVTNTAIPQAERREVDMSLRAYLGATEVCNVRAYEKVPKVMSFTLF